MAAFALFYRVKGGIVDSLFKNTLALRARSKVYDALLSSKFISYVLLLAFLGGLYSQGYFEWPFIALVLIGWAASIAPSHGEEYGVIVYEGPHKDYNGFGRPYGLKKAIQRGVFGGACMTLFTGSIWFIPFGLLFIPCVWVSYKIRKEGEWWPLSEWLYGALGYGIPFGLWILGF